MKTVLATIAAITLASGIAQASTYKCVGLDDQQLTTVNIESDDAKPIGTLAGAKVQMVSFGNAISLSINNGETIAVVSASAGSNISYDVVSKQGSVSLHCFKAK